MHAYIHNNYTFNIQSDIVWMDTSFKMPLLLLLHLPRINNTTSCNIHSILYTPFVVSYFHVNVFNMSQEIKGELLCSQVVFSVTNTC